MKRLSRLQAHLVAYSMITIMWAGIAWIIRDWHMPWESALLLGIYVTLLADITIHMMYWRYRWKTRLSEERGKQIPYLLFVERKLWKSNRRNHITGKRAFITALVLTESVLIVAYTLAGLAQNVAIAFLLGLAVGMFVLFMLGQGLQWRKIHQQKPQEASPSA